MRLSEVLLISCGDPHGIGPELIVKGISGDLYSRCLVVGSREVFEYYAGLYSLTWEVHYIEVEGSEVDVAYVESQVQADALNVVSFEYAEELEPGRVSEYAARMALLYVRAALACIRMGVGGVLVTGPINKQAVLGYDKGFVGQTEYIAAWCGMAGTMCMLSKSMILALTTTHVPLERVACNLSVEGVLRTLLHLDAFLKNALQRPCPRIAVCSLNPHGGEGGKLGVEEQQVVIPAVERAQGLDVLACGPYSADTLFARYSENKYDAYVALYHDQGLIPFKLLSFGRGVNASLGLPFMRFSVDHGTAFDIAGKNCADTSNFVYVLRCASAYLNNSLQDALLL